jgi:lactoylglutathione lyase
MATKPVPDGYRTVTPFLSIENAAEAIAFYERAFGLTRRFVADDGSYGELDTGATGLAFASEGLGEGNFDGGVQRPPRDGRPFNVEIALVFDDVAAAYEHALAGGCDPLAPPEHKSHGQDVAYVRDPFGTLVEVCSPVG